MYDHMIVDGRNAVYRAVYAGLSDEMFVKTGHDMAVVFYRFMASYLNKFKPKAVHICWDAPKTDLWRRKIWRDYKDGRDTSHGGKYAAFDVDALVERCSMLVREFAPAMNCRNYARDRQEADDLIYAFCKLNLGRKILIVSSDGDFKQIAFMMRNIDIFNPLNKKEGMLEIDPEVDPVDLKCYSGEKGDNILGYYNIGPKRARVLATDPEKRKKFFEIYGRKTYLRNRALIDLTMCPYTFSNLAYIQKAMTTEVKYDERSVREIIQKYKVKGLLGEVSRNILPFKFIGG